jgi:hypothetical protein
MTDRAETEDVWRPLHPDAKSLREAWGAASLAAEFRDRGRSGVASWGLIGENATGFAMWAVGRADRTTRGESVRAARRAADGDAREAELAAELRRFIGDYLSGRVDETERHRRMMDPRGSLEAPPPKRPQRKRSKAREGVVLHSKAAERLEALIEEFAPSGSPQRIWHAFQKFASVPLEPDADEQIDEAGELLLYEWGVFPTAATNLADEAFTVHLVRQIHVLDPNGMFVDYTQVHAELAFQLLPELAELGSGSIWSDGPSGTYDAFYAAVEASPASAALTGKYTVAAVTAYQHGTE